MGDIKALLEIDYIQTIYSLLILVVGFTAICTVIGKFSIIIGRPIKWLTNANSDHLLLAQTVENVTQLQKRHEEDMKISTQNDEAIKQELSKLSDMLLDKEIDDMRWNILDFASRLSTVNCGKEQFDHVIAIHEKYEKILAENGMKNGQVDASMEIIMEVYKEKLKNGF